MAAEERVEKERAGEVVDPGQRKLTDRQAKRLAELAGVSVAELADTRFADVGDILKWRIDPKFFTHRRVCGRVVKTDPVTGVVQGVPGATVHVMDTDCSFLGYFPVESPLWWWLWPVSCTTEEIATAVTDECGNFCVWIPLVDIDYVVRWREERFCIPEIVKPSLRDILDRVVGPWPIDPPVPPGPRLDTEFLDRARQFVDGPKIDALEAVAADRRFGAVDETLEILEAPAFTRGSFPPSLPGGSIERLGEIVDIDAYPDPSKDPFVGPFLRCHDVFVPEWITIEDAPDITFQVTQDIDDDGNEETVYAEGIFDVRWNDASAGVIIEAWPSAVTSDFCEGPDLPCVDVPTIESAGLMPLQPSHHDGDGYATRVNRPHPGGLSTDAPAPGESATTPYSGTLQLHGCHHIEGAKYYRVLYRYRTEPTDPLNAEVPFLGFKWWAARIGMSPLHVVPDANGWYEILPMAQMVFPHWLLNWPTGTNGQYELRVEVGDAGKSPMASSAPVRFFVDNRGPKAGFTSLAWRPKGTSGWNPLPLICPVVDRTSAAPIEIQAEWWAGAPHFRNAILSVSGCGADKPTLTGGASDADHWHVSAADNFVTRTAVMEIPANAKAGCYSFHLHAVARGFNPSGSGGGPADNWFTDQPRLQSHARVSISVTD